MKNLIVALTVALAVISCEKPYNNKPDNLLSESEMTDLLVDLYLNQQLLNFAPPKSDYTLKMAENTLAILKEHKIDPHDFEVSYKYYFTNPEEYQEILADVKDKLKDQLSAEEKANIEASEARKLEIK